MAKTLLIMHLVFQARPPNALSPARGAPSASDPRPRAGRRPLNALAVRQPIAVLAGGCGQVHPRLPIASAVPALQFACAVCLRHAPARECA